MNIILCALGGFIIYFVLGGIFFTLPGMRNEFMKFSVIYRSSDGIKKVMPFGMIAMFIAMVTLAIIFGRMYPGSTGAIEGAQFGGLVGTFCVCSFVIHNYVNLNIGGKLTLLQSIAYFFEWLAVGITIGIIHAA